MNPRRFFPARLRHRLLARLHNRRDRRFLGNAVAEDRGYRNGDMYFVHIPKCGGVSMRSALSAADVGFVELENIPWEGTPAFEPARLINVHRSTKWLSANGILSESWLSRVPIFTVVRNPVTRVLSAFRYSIRVGYIRDSWTLLDYLRYLRREQPKIAGGKVVSLSFGATQVAFLDGVLDRPNTHLLRLERLENDIQGLENLLGCRLAIPHLNRSPSATEYDLRDSEKRLIRKIYGEDFERFGY